MTFERSRAPLAPLTTIGLGGPADRLIRAESEEELIETVREADRDREKVFVIAGGSNVVIADEGVHATAIHVASHGIKTAREPDERVSLTVQAGEQWNAVVAASVADRLSGLECLAGIPGTTGATPIQNVGAYGQEVASTITALRVYDRESGETVTLAPADCGFGYRTSRFKGGDRYVVLAVTFTLTPSELSEPVAYPQLAEALGIEVGQRAPLSDVRIAVHALRRAKGMVIDPTDPDSVSVGSFFTNPVLTGSDFEQLQQRAAERVGPDDQLPTYPAPEGRVKTSAAWLIERSGFSRGYGDGDVGISDRHTLALINRGEGTTAELVALAREIADGVERDFGVKLVPEPVFVGHSW
ncbi:MAG: UDP-N-acetylmuramate dehydrogenase [Thermoleophilia bacterium]|nr:UDP-N-acetylmuramate dehydrogenase [Thermoleophilia bacterium]